MFNRDKQDTLGEIFNCEDNTLDIITDLSNLHDNICSQ